MASWLEHPRYLRLRAGLVEHLQPPKYRFRRLRPVVFLCGANGSEGRDAIRDYLQKFKPDLSVFYAERVWEIISTLGEPDALQMEAELAKLADLVVVIVESPGTFAELGAFSISSPLRKKLLPIVDKRYEHVESFIASGPLRWIDKESDFKPTIFTKIEEILLCASELDERLGRITKPRTTRLEDLATSTKHLLFFICDLVSVIYPAPLSLIVSYLQEISANIASSGISVPTLVGLAVAMGLMRRLELNSGTHTETYYVPTELVNASRPFHHSRYLYLENQRAAYTSVLLTFPEARMLMEAASAAKCS